MDDELRQRVIQSQHSDMAVQEIYNAVNIARGLIGKEPLDYIVHDVKRDPCVRCIVNQLIRELLEE